MHFLSVANHRVCDFKLTAFSKHVLSNVEKKLMNKGVKLANNTFSLC